MPDETKSICFKMQGEGELYGFLVQSLLTAMLFKTTCTHRKKTFAAGIQSTGQWHIYVIWQKEAKVKMHIILEVLKAQKTGN